MDAIRFRAWKKTAAGKLSRDFLRWIRDKQPEPEYFLLVGETLKTVIRLVTDEEEIREFNHLGLLNGKIKDSYYMHVKTVGIEESLHEERRYIQQTSVDSEVNDSEDKEDEENSHKSKSLF